MKLYLLWKLCNKSLCPEPCVVIQVECQAFLHARNHRALCFGAVADARAWRIQACHDCACLAQLLWMLRCKMPCQSDLLPMAFEHQHFLRQLYQDWSTELENFFCKRWEAQFCCGYCPTPPNDCLFGAKFVNLPRISQIGCRLALLALLA